MVYLTNYVQVRVVWFPIPFKKILSFALGKKDVNDEIFVFLF